jgi:putative inorganic carbon (HCO3(-)) transporter
VSGGGERAAVVKRVLLGAFVVGLAVSITLAEVTLLLLAVRWLFRVATGRARGGWPLAVPFGAFVLASLLAAARSEHPLESVVAAKGLLLVAAFYVTLDALADAADADRLITALLALGALIAAVGGVQVIACPWRAALEPWAGKLIRNCHRAHAFYSIYMTLAGVLSLVLLAAMPRLLSADSADERRTGRILAWLVGGVGLALTYVRGAWVGFGVGVATVLAVARRSRLLAIAGIGLLVVVVLVTPGLRRRAESIADPADPTARDRVSMWRSGLAMVADHPLTGIGPGQVKREYRRYAAPDALQKSRGHLHDTPLQILVERGIIGLAAWLAIFIAFFRRAAGILRALPAEQSQARALVVGAVAAIAGFLAGGLTEYNFGDSEVVTVAYVIMAIVFVAGRGSTPTGPGSPEPAGEVAGAMPKG